MAVLSSCRYSARCAVQSYPAKRIYTCLPFFHAIARSHCANSPRLKARKSPPSHVLGVGKIEGYDISCNESQPRGIVFAVASRFSVTVFFFNSIILNDFKSFTYVGNESSIVRVGVPFVLETPVSFVFVFASCMKESVSKRMMLVLA